MRQLRQMLRLAGDGTSSREIAQRLGIARSTVQDNLKRAEAAGLSWPLPSCGGDEFAIILGDNGSTEHVAELAERLVSAICEPFHIDGDVLSVGASIGVAMAPINGTRPDQGSFAGGGGILR
jgi:predicted signal transduction protein with EAL and GGDEF domain